MKHNHYIFAFFILVIWACSESKQTQPESTAATDENTVTLTQAQYEAAGISMTGLQKRNVGNHIRVNGMIDVPPQSLVSVSPPIGGFVRNTTLKEGMKVRKGDLLATLENIEFIQLQQDYLENRSKLEFLESEFRRQEELARENINSGKATQQARSNFEAMAATVKALEAKLKMINISTEDLLKGDIRSQVNIYSPIDGFVSSLNVTVGQFVNPTDAMVKIVNLDHLHVLLYVYEKDISAIREGQEVRFRPSDENEDRLANVYLIGKEITNERTVHVHCHLKKERQNLLPGMFVSATIEVGDRESVVLPSEAVLTFHDKHVVFASTGKEREFRMVTVTPGLTTNEFVEVSFDGKAPDAQFVATGADHLLGVLKNAGEED